MRHRYGVLVAPIIFALLTSHTFADVLTRTFEFSPSGLRFSTHNGYDQIYLAGCDITRVVGKPQLPVKTEHVALPPGARIEEIEILSSKAEYLPGTYQVFPCQPPCVLSRGAPKAAFVLPDSSVYSQTGVYPGRLTESARSGGLGGYQLAGIKLYPLQYEPQSRRIKFYTKITAAISYTTDGDRPLAVTRHKSSTDKTHSLLPRFLVANPEALVRHTETPVLHKASVPAGGPYDYIIITSSSFVPAFSPLADWKTKKGVPATIVTTDWIYANYSGCDQAEQVRNFVKDAYQQWGAVWILLGGDTPVVPHRYVWTWNSEVGFAPDEDNIPTDLYFSDLDGDWDANLNGIYGEVGDNIDLYPDVFVGRASCDSYDEAVAWVNKLITYEANPPTDYQLDMAFFSEVWLTDPYSDGGLAADLLDDRYVPPRYDPITKLYQSSGNENHTTVMQALNYGQSIVNHNGHCYIEVMSIGGGSLHSSDMDALTNGSRQTSFIFSVGCWPAAFEYDCIAEHFINNPHGGSVAFIGNSRYGWGSPGNAEFGYSDMYNQQIYAALFDDDLHHLGAMLAKAKAVYAPHSHDAGVYRYCNFQTNLLGDPEMPIWTDLPQQFFVHHPDTIPSGGGEYTIVVTTADTSHPAGGAMVCLHKENDVYERALTATDGMAQFAVTPSSDGIMTVTVTAHNFIPYQGDIVVGVGGTYVDYKHYNINDAASGNGDGVINPGETVDLWMTVLNHGPGETKNLSGYLISRGNVHVALVDSVLDFGDIPAGAEATCLTTCEVDIDPDCPNGHVALFDWLLVDDGGQSFSGILSVQVAGAVLSYCRYIVDDPAGNGNHIPEPGETCNMRVWGENQGLADATSVTAGLWTDDPWITIIGSPVSYGDIFSGNKTSADYTIEIDPSCPSPHFAELFLDLTATGYPVCHDTLLFTVGSTGCTDDMEGGTSEWTHGGANDLWTLTDHRAHSGSASWYCGNPGSWSYGNNMDCWLDISPVVLGPDSRLTFWSWLSVTNFGVDGCYVIVTDYGSGEVDTVGFIGSGGALDSALFTGNDWTKEFYDLSAYPVGTEVGVRILFATDGTDVAEGIYIDDVRIESRPDYDVEIEPPNNELWGGEGDTVIYSMRVDNRGFWEDSFTLTLSTGVWETTVWNQDRTAEISEIGPLAPGTSEDILVAVVVPVVPFGAADTEVLTAASVHDPDRTAWATVATSSEGEKGAVPWLDRFLDDELDRARWPAPGNSAIEICDIPAPTSPYVLDLTGGSSAVTQKIDLSGNSTIRLAFWYWALNTSHRWCTNDLVVECLTADGAWVNLTYLSGDQPQESEFEELILELPVDEYHAGFRVRFRATPCHEGHWFVDDVYLGPQRDHHFVNRLSDQPGYGAVGEEAVHFLTIENRGALIDRYHFSIVSENWPATFWDDSGEITQTDLMAPGETAVIRVQVAVPGGTPLLEADTTLVKITSAGSGDEWRYSYLHSVCVGETAAFPWFDDFPGATLTVERWPIQLGVDVSWQGEETSSPPYAMRVGFDNTVISQKIDLSNPGSAMLDFFCRAGANYMIPGEHDSVFVEFLDRESKWGIVRKLGGGGRWKSEFTRYCENLPVSARHRGFQLRIRAKTESGSWYFDDVRVVLPPECKVSPESVEFTLDAGQSATTTVAIDNLGPGELDYRINVIPSDFLAANLLARQTSGVWLSKTAGFGSRDLYERYRSALDGPDDYGYMWIDSDEPYGPVFSWEDISGYGQQLQRLDAFMYDTLHLDFAFPYYDTAYTHLLVSWLGALQFGPLSGITGFRHFPIPHSIAPNNILAWCWSQHQTLGTVYAYSTADRAIIQFDNFGDSTDIFGRCATAQVELAADGRISYRYLHFGEDFPTDDCGVGIENKDGSDGLGVVFYVNPLQDDPEYLHDSLQIDFFPPPGWLSVDPAAGFVGPGSTQPVALDFDAEDLAAGTYDALLRVSSNDPDTVANPFYITALLTVYDPHTCLCPLGDVNLDGMISPVDVVYLVNYALRGGPPPANHPQCPYSLADVRFDGFINLLDIVRLIDYVYRGGPPPVEPCTF